MILLVLCLLAVCLPLLLSQGQKSSKQVRQSPLVLPTLATECSSRDGKAMKDGIVMEDKENSPLLVSCKELILVGMFWHSCISIGLSAPKETVQCTQNDLDFLDQLKNFKMCEDLQVIYSRGNFVFDGNR